MPTIFERISSGLAGNDLIERLKTQADKLGSISTTLNDLAANPPRQITDLINNLKNVHLPDINLSGELPGAINTLRSIIPANPDEIAGGLARGLTSLSESIGHDILDRIKPVINAFSSIHSLIAMVSGAKEFHSKVPGFPPVTFPVASSKALTSTFLVDEIDKILDILNTFPDPFTIGNILPIALEFLDAIQQKISCVPGTYIPFINEIHQTLATISEWQTYDGAGIAGHIQSTLLATGACISQGINPAIEPVIQRISILDSALDTEIIKTTYEGLSQKLDSLGSAVEANDLAGINAILLELNSLSAQCRAIMQDLKENFFSGQSENLEEWCTELPFNLESQIHRVLSTIDPESDSEITNTLADTINNSFDANHLTDFLGSISSIKDWFKNLLDTLDITAIEEPVKTAATAAQSAVDALDGMMIEIVAKVSILFDKVDGIISLVDTEAITGAIENALADFREMLKTGVDALFIPIRDAVSGIITSIDGAVGGFKPEDILDSLRSAIQSLAGIVTDPDVMGTLNNIKGILDKVIKSLDSISFTPMNDQVIRQIEKVAAVLKGIDTSDLNAILRTALKAALEVLPADDAIDSLKKALCDEMSNLIESGPVPVLNLVKQQPAWLLQTIQEYSPLNLVGEKLSKPFQDLINRLQAFTPGSLFTPVQDTLDGIKSDLEKSANPGRFLSPLEKPFNDLIKAFDNLKPADMVIPLQNLITDTRNRIMDALPVDEFFTIVDSILQLIQVFFDNVEAIKKLLEKVLRILHGLDNPEQQVNEWIQNLTGRLDNVPASFDLGPAFGQVRDAINAIKAEPLKSQVAEPMQSFIDRIDALKPQDLLNNVVRKYRDFPHTAIESLPEPEKQSVRNFFSQFDPLHTDISGPMSGLQVLSENLKSVLETAADFFADWDNRYHGPNSPLSSFIPSDTSIQAVKQILVDTLNLNVKKPLTAIMQIFPPVTRLIDGFLTVFTGSISELKTKFTVMLDSPASLTSIRDAMNTIVKKIQGFNLDFLANELEELFGNVRGKLDLINPGVLRGIVEENFRKILEDLDITGFIPGEELNKLDAAYLDIINKAALLDPQKLVTKIVQPEFDEMIAPYLEAFDLSGSIQKLIDRLDRLKEELTKELDRTGDAFKKMLAASPV